MLLVHLQKLEGTSTPVTLHLRSLHKRVLQVPRQPQVLHTSPTLEGTPSSVEPLALEGRSHQLQGPVEREAASRHHTDGQVASVRDSWLNPHIVGNGARRPKTRGGMTILHSQEEGMVAELWPPRNSYVEVLTPRTLKCN